jgi:hypothetical protein
MSLVRRGRGKGGVELRHGGENVEDDAAIILVRDSRQIFSSSNSSRFSTNLTSENFSPERSSLDGYKNMFYVRVEWFLLARDENDKVHFV